MERKFATFLNKFLLLKNTFLLTSFPTLLLFLRGAVCASSRCGCIYLGRKKERESAMRGCVHCAAGGRLALAARSQPWPFPAPHIRERKERKAEERECRLGAKVSLSFDNQPRVRMNQIFSLMLSARAHRRNKVASMLIWYYKLWWWWVAKRKEGSHGTERNDALPIILDANSWLRHSPSQLCPFSALSFAISTHSTLSTNFSEIKILLLFNEKFPWLGVKFKTQDNHKIEISYRDFFFTSQN